MKGNPKQTDNPLKIPHPLTHSSRLVCEGRTGGGGGDLKSILRGEVNTFFLMLIVIQRPGFASMSTNCIILVKWVGSVCTTHCVKNPPVSRHKKTQAMLACKFNPLNPKNMCDMLRHTTKKAV